MPVTPVFDHGDADDQAGITLLRFRPRI